MFRRLLKSLTCMLLCCAVILFGFTACQDLGEDVKIEADYYILFPTVTMVALGEVDTANMEDLYNKETSENLTSPFATEKEYLYMIIAIDPPAGKVLTCDSVAMYLLYSGDIDQTLEVSCFICDNNAFKKITTETDSFTENPESIIGSTTANLKAIINNPKAKQPQNSFVLNFAKSEFSTFGYIVVIFKRTTPSTVAFRPTNVMIHTNSLKDGE